MTIGSRIQMLTVAAVLLTTALVAPVIFWGFSTLIDRQRAEAADRLLEIEDRAFAASIAELEHDVALLLALPALDGLAARQPDIAAALPPERLKTVLAQVYAAMAAAKPHYHQIRLIGVADGGRELVRVDRTAAGIARMPEAGLQAKGQRPYVVEALQTPAGQTYLAQIELNREHGVIEQPERPTLRIARPVLTGVGPAFGVLVINVDFAPMIREIVGQPRPDRDWLLANADGHYIWHPDPTKAFGFDRGAPQRVQDDHPRLAPLFTVGGPEALSVRTADGRTAWRRIALPPLAGYDRLYIGMTIREAPGAEAEIARLGLLGVALALGLTLLVGLFAARRLARPLARMSRVAVAIAENREPEELPTARPDEIGVLARSFERMLERLEEKRHDLKRANSRLQQANADLEQFAYVATHDLREPARRTAAIADLLLFDEADRVSDEGREMLERLQAVAENMLDRLADFRVLSGLGSGTLSRVETDLEGLLDRALSESGARVDDPRVTIERHPLPRLAVYPELLALAWRNLISDMVRRSDGPIRLVFAARAPRPDEPDAGVVLTLTVRGVSLSPDVARTLLTRAARLGEGDGGAGDGLGLTICRRIAERHGGWITLTNTDEQLAFAFSLGATDERPPEAG